MSEFAKKIDLAYLKSNVEKPDADKFDLINLSNLIKEDVKNRTFDELVKIVDTIKSNKQNLEEKIEGVNKKLSDTIKFNVTKGFNRLTKNFLLDSQKHRQTFQQKNKYRMLFTWDKKIDKILKKNQNFVLSYFIGKSYFDDDGLQKSFKIFTGIIDKIFR